MSVDVDVTVRADGLVSVRQIHEFVSPQGGTVSLRAPVLARATNVVVAGGRRSDAADGASVSLRGPAERVDVSFDLVGAVERYHDVAVVTVPLWTPPADAGKHDPPVAVRGTVSLPAPPHEGAAHFHTAAPAGVEIDGDVVRVDGRVAMNREADLVVAIPSDAVATLPVLAGGERFEYFQGRQSSLDRANAALADDIDEEERHQDMLAVGYWGLVGLEVATPFAIALPRMVRGSVRRRRALAGVPEYLVDSPGDDKPAVVALLGRRGHDIGHEAVAATVLDLAARNVIELSGVSSDRYVLRLRNANDRKMATAGETAVLEGLDAAAGPSGELSGPPLGIDPRGGWWRALRRDTLLQAKAARLVQRRYPSPVFGVAVVLLTATTFPLWARSPEAAIGGWVVAAIMCMVPYVGGYVLTPAGHKALARWEAFGRYGRDHSEMESVSAPAVAVWGPHLVYATALRLAPRAVEDLAPRGPGG